MEQTTGLALEEVAGGLAGLGRHWKAEVWAAGLGQGEGTNPAGKRQSFKAPVLHS